MKIIALFFVFLLVGQSYSKRYDYIIVGSGSSGSVLANELSADPDVSVLLLERGEDQCDTFYETVAYFGGIIKPSPTADITEIAGTSIYDEHLYTRELDLNTYSVPSPKMFGGGALRNGNAFGRISAAELLGFESDLWTFNATTDDWKALFSYQKCVPGPCDTNAHGTTGPLHYNTFDPDSVLQTTTDLLMSKFGMEWDEDSNDGTNRGMSILHRNIKASLEGVFRQEGYCGLLKLVIPSRPNLDVKSSAVVTKIIIKENEQNRVEYFHQGDILTDKATREVIISAGALETPKLLKLSGVGPCDELESFGIDCVVSNPHVGEDLKANAIDAFLFITPEPTTPSYGSIVTGYTNDDDSDGKDLNDYQIAASTFILPTPAGVKNAIQVLFSDYNQGSTGSVTLKSKSPFDTPVFSANFYVDHPERLVLFKNKIQAARQALLDHNNNVGFPYFYQISPSLDVLPSDATDAQWFTYLESKEGYAPDWHWTGSTSMHKVVDERLRLIDGEGNIIPGIRIVGNGVVPNCLRSHSTSSFSMLVGQVASRLIQEDNA